MCVEFLYWFTEHNHSCYFKVSVSNHCCTLSFVLLYHLAVCLSQETAILRNTNPPHPTPSVPCILWNVLEQLDHCQRNKLQHFNMRCDFKPIQSLWSRDYLTSLWSRDPKILTPAWIMHLLYKHLLRKPVRKAEKSTRSGTGLYWRWPVIWKSLFLSVLCNIAIRGGGQVGQWQFGKDKGVTQRQFFFYS